MPLTLSAQVEVDTVIDLGFSAYNGYFIPELNKLYLRTPYGLQALDCSTWQAVEVPVSFRWGYAYYAYSPVQRKLYVHGDVTGKAVIDVMTDTLVTKLPSGFSHHMTYVPGRDQLYIGGSFGMAVVDCATDSVIKVIPSPVPGYTSLGYAAYDSVADRIYASTLAWDGPPYFVAYDSADSVLKIFPPEGLSSWPGQLFFCPQSGKAYYTIAHYWGAYNRPGVVDTYRMEHIRSLPFRAVDAGSDAYPLAVHTRDGKIYYATYEQESRIRYGLHVVDIKTDSVLKEHWLFTGWGIMTMRWVPWSNRLYASSRIDQFLVLDCANDSVIVENMVLPGQASSPGDILLDPVRERIFIVGAETTKIYILRDVPYGLREERGSSIVPRAGPTIIRISLVLPASLITYHSSLITSDGRKVMELQPGENDVRHLAPGVYFVRTALWERSPGRDFIRKVVIQR